MKILIFNWRCWVNPDAGGAEVFTREVAKRWVAAGNEVTLFTSEFKGCKKEEILDGVRIVRAGGRFSVYRRARKLYDKRFRHEGFDVVIDEINTRPFFAPKFVKDGVKVVGLIHQLAREYWFYETPFPISYVGYRFLEDRWLRVYVDVPTVTVSESTKKDLEKLGFKSVSVVSEGLNFMPLDTIPKKEANPVLIYVGRLKRAKRPNHAIKAYEIIRNKFPDAELWIIGEGEFEEELKKMSGKGVKFFTGLSDVERRQLIRKSWVLMNPSVREGWGLNIVEANALGVPVVAYDVSGLRDSVKDGETGLLVKGDDIEKFAAAIVAVLSDDNLRVRLSGNALKYAREFSWDKAAVEFAEVVELVVCGQRVGDTNAEIGQIP